MRFLLLAIWLGLCGCSQEGPDPEKVFLNFVNASETQNVSEIQKALGTSYADFEAQMLLRFGSDWPKAYAHETTELKPQFARVEPLIRNTRVRVYYRLNSGTEDFFILNMEGSEWKIKWPETSNPPSPQLNEFKP